MYAELEAIRDALAALPEVKTAKIGLEAGITPADYPIVRIVPDKLSGSSLKPGPAVPRACEALIYFGVAAHEFEDGLEALYAKLFELELVLLRTAQAVATVKHLETLFDRDADQAFKVFALRVEVIG